MERARGPAAFAIAAMLIAVGCRAAGATNATGAPGATVGAQSSSLPGGIATETLKVSVTDATYGALSATTTGGALCSGLLRVGAGHFGEAPPDTLPIVAASAAGVARWTYPSPRVPKGTATYSVTCTSGSTSGTATGSFTVEPGAMRATAFTAHVTVDAPPNATFNPDPSLVPLRDAAAAKMKATLASEWKSATRGLGSLEVVEQSPDITVYLVAARGTSVHRGFDDGSQDVVVYVSDTFGPQSIENVVATALHELGHIWCCYGPGTYPSGTEQQGHWLTNERSPGLYGVDKYGLMTDPVTCIAFGAILSCPNRFSDREMTALGFTGFPPPTIDPCVSQALSLKASLAAIGAQLGTLATQIDAQQASLTSIKQQLQALDARYAAGMPPSVVTQYNALVDQYNAIVAQNRATVDTYNGLAAQSRAQASQINSLPCDAS